MNKRWFFTGLNIWIALLLHASCPAGVFDHWTTNQISTNSYGLDFVVYAENRYVAFGEYSDWGVTVSSENGITWSVRDFGGQGMNQTPLSWSTALSYCGGKFLAFGGFGFSAVSPDGIVWQDFQLQPNISGAAHNGSVFIAAVTDTFSTLPKTGFYESLDGLTWFQLPSQVISTLTGGLGDIAFGAGRFVAIGTGTIAGHTYTSSAGTNWTERSIPGGRIISYCNSIFIVPFGPGTNLVSTNGIDWAILQTGLTNEIGRAKYDRGSFFALAGPYLAASADGTNWFQYSKPLPNFLRALATDGTRLVGVGGQYNPATARLNAFTYYTEPLVDLETANTFPPQISLSGLVGRSYRIEWTENLTAGTPTWQTGVTLQLPSDPFVWTDPTAGNSTQRFYRAVLLP